MRQTASSEALAVLQQQKDPINVRALMNGMTTSSPRSTVARALRRMRAKGLVSSKRNGGKWVLWSFNMSQPAKMSVSKQQPKGAAGRNTMCRPDNMPTLCKAIDDTVAGLITNKTEFSAFDVTKAIREEVGGGKSSIDTSETDTVYVGGQSVAKIDHDIVKETVHDLFKRGEMAGYDRSFNGSHFVYAESIDDPIDDSDPDDGNDDIDGNDADDAASGDSYDGSSSLG